MRHDEVLQLERDGWEALTTGGDAAMKHYDDVLARDVLMLLPGGMVIADRDQVVASMREADWSSYRMEDERCLALGEDAVVVGYKGVAERPGAPEYTALFNSTYVREDGEWKLALHQQTPA